MTMMLKLYKLVYNRVRGYKPLQVLVVDTDPTAANAAAQRLYAKEYSIPAEPMTTELLATEVTRLPGGYVSSPGPSHLIIPGTGE